MTEFQIWKSQFHKRLIENNPPTKKPTKVTTPQVKTITPPTPKTTSKTNYISKAKKSFSAFCVSIFTEVPLYTSIDPNFSINSEKVISCLKIGSKSYLTNHERG